MQGKKGKVWGETVIRGLVVGRDGVVIPPEQVEELARIGCSDKEISEFFGVTNSVINQNFSVEKLKGRLELKQRLRKAMLENAIVKMNVVMQIFLAKNMLGMSDNGLVSENTVLPWTDSFDGSTVEDDDTQSSDTTGIVEQ